MHLGRMLGQFGFLLACFVTERKHKDFKAFATACTNLKTFEETVSINMISSQVAALQVPDAVRTGTYLINPVDDDGGTYAIQYICERMSDLDRYHAEHATRLRKEHSDRYQQKIAAFRTILEVLNED